MTNRESFTATAKSLADQVAALIRHPGRIPSDMPGICSAQLRLQELASTPRPVPLETRPHAPFQTRGDIGNGIPASERDETQERV